jgi:hypothetical protein
MTEIEEIKLRNKILQILRDNILSEVIKVDLLLELLQRDERKV